MAKSFREKMAEMIIAQGDELWTIEKDDGKDIVMWYIKDHASRNDPYGREPQYQVWSGNKRCYVGSNRQNAYADFKHQQEEFIASWALI